MEKSDIKNRKHQIIFFAVFYLASILLLLIIPAKMSGLGGLARVGLYYILWTVLFWVVAGIHIYKIKKFFLDLPV
jgi:hypothetical protein